MKKISLIFLTILAVFLFCSISIFAFTGNNIKVNITMGVGESRVISNYTKNSTTQVTWSVEDNSVAYINNNQIYAKSTGTTVITGTSGEYLYTFNIKVLENSTETNTLSTKSTATSTQTVKSDGSTISYKDYNLKIGVKDVVDITGLLPNKYDKYSWRMSNNSYISYSRGVVKGLKEGIVTLTAAGNTSSNKNSIYRLYITVDNDTLSKVIKLNKQKTENLSNYIGDAENFKFAVVAGQGSAVSVSESGVVTTPNATGTCIVTAESLIGEKNYTFLIKTI